MLRRPGGQPSQLLGWFVPTDGPKAGESLKLMGSALEIGRDPVRDVTIDDETVSASHAQILAKDDTVYIVDLNSSNGTKLNGGELEPYQRAVLSDEAEIEIGAIKLQFKRF